MTTLKISIKKVDIIIIECSSHGLDQGRLNGINFNTSIFTNITSDHLDYHVTKSEYIKAKLKLMRQTSESIYINDDCMTLKKIKKEEMLNSLNIISQKKSNKA